MIKLTIHKNRIGPIRGRHPWVFQGAIKKIPEGLSSGMIVHLFDERGDFLAQGYFNSYSQMAVRLWSWDEEEKVDLDFFVKRVRSAYDLRKQYVESKDTNAYRLVNSENDLLPGLIVDKYDDYLCVQFHNQGIELWKMTIIDALEKVIKPKGIYERSDVGERKTPACHCEERGTSDVAIPSNVGGRKSEGSTRFLPLPEGETKRGREGEAKDLDSSATLQNDKTSGVIPAPCLPAGKKAGIQEGASSVILTRQLAGKDLKGATGIVSGTIPEKIKIMENGLKFWVDLAGGQKTGFFLDQRDKRQAIQKYADGKNVLNCFSYTGGFSVSALFAGAKKVVNVDSSEDALALAEENIKLNGFNGKKSEFVCADVKDYLRQILEKSPDEREEFDLIILDPPAFVKDRRKIREGLMGYRNINESALRLLSSGGILVTASCSTHVSMQDFRYAVSESAGRAHKTLQILETYTHGIDHPELVAFGEGEYLKCLICRVV